MNIQQRTIKKQEKPQKNTTRKNPILPTLFTPVNMEEPACTRR